MSPRTSFAGPSGALVFLLVSLSLAIAQPRNATADCVPGQDGLHLIGAVSLPGLYASAWGVKVVGSLAYVTEYSSGLYVIDVSDPTSPTILGHVTTAGHARGLDVSGTFVYVAVSDRGLQVIDVSNPAAPVARGRVVTPGASDVVVSGNLAYLADGIALLKIINVSNPDSLVIVGSVDTPSGAAGDIVLSGSIAYVPDILLQVITVLNPTNPAILNSVDTSGWASHVALSGNTLYVTNPYNDPYGPPGLQVYDISNPTSPINIGSLVGTPMGDMLVTGTIGYVVAGSQLKSIDVSNPASPVFGESVNLPVGGSGLAVAGNLIYVADNGGGLQIVEHCFGTVAVLLTSFHASAQSDAILLEWETSLDSDVSGFYVERSREATGEYIRVSGGLIPPASPYRFTDSDVTPGVTYFYRLEALDRAGKGAFFGPISARFEGGSMRPTLGQAFPNPVSDGSSTIPFIMSLPGLVQLRVLDLAGKEVRLLVNKRMEAGAQSVYWDGRDNQGHLVHAGTYIYQLRAPGFESSRKLMRLR